MFRSAFRSATRAAAASSTPVLRVQSAKALSTALTGRVVVGVESVASAAAKTAAPRLSVVAAARWYSAAAGLTKEEVEGRIVSLLQGFDKVTDPANIKPTSHFANDLGLDSLDTVEVVMAIEEEFSIEIPDKDADTIHSVDKAVEYILHQPDAH